MVTGSTAAGQPLAASPQIVTPEARSTDQAGEATATRQPHPFWLPLVLTAVAAVALVVFVAIARVPIGAGWREGRSLAVREIWFLFTQELRVSLGWLAPGPITALVAVILAGCVLALWLAMAVTDEPPAPRAD